MLRWSVPAWCVAPLPFDSTLPILARGFHSLVTYKIKNLTCSLDSCCLCPWSRRQEHLRSILMLESSIASPRYHILIFAGEVTRLDLWCAWPHLACVQSRARWRAVLPRATALDASCRLL